MFQKQATAKSDLKSEKSRLGASSEALAAAPSSSSNYDIKNKSERVMQSSASTSKQTPHQNYLSNISREEIKSHKIPQHQQRNSNFHSLSQQANSANREMQFANSSNITNQHHNLNQRNGLIQSNMIRSTTNPQLYQASPLPPHQEQATTTGFHQVASSSATPQTKSAFNNTCDTTNTGSSSSGSDNRNGRHQPKQRLSSANSTSTTVNAGSQLSRDGQAPLYRHQQDHQQERETNEVVTKIKEEMENNFIENFKESDLDTLGSLELPIELSFLLRQQAVCMARMNYLDRQIRELKEARQQPQVSTVVSSSNNQSHHGSRTNGIPSNNINAPSTAHIKNGNFIPSDDSGGEYSRATISDDDELSSLLDQIAKSIKPDRNFNPNMRMSNPNQPLQQPQHHHIHQQRANYNVMTQQPQPYAILAPNHQLHHQAVPVFVMSSPIAMAHPSSISSTVLPGVHFQPEPRYNQYYEDFYVQNNNSSSSTMHTGPRHSGLRSSQQFDSHISAIEQLVSQKEKRQIKSQLKSADNWLKMRSSGFCNLNGNFNESSNSTSNGTVTGGDESGRSTDRNRPAPTLSDTNRTENSSSEIE